MASTTIGEVRVQAALVPVVLMAEAAEAMSSTELDALIETFQRAQDVGHFLDPTKWRDLYKDRAAILDLLRATAGFRKAAAKFLAARADLIAARDTRDATRG